MTSVFVMKESRPGETRVAASPDSVKRLIKTGLAVTVQADAGRAAGFEDADFTSEGASIGGEAELGAADVVLKVGVPTPEEVARLKEGAVLLSYVLATANPEVVDALRARRIRSLAMELVPRITRAQSMDALSSQATVAGYKAVLMGAAEMPVLCPLLMTAAGTVPPARAVVFGAGVAGLQAIATAKRLGCKVEATDVRLAAKEQVESLGAKFIDVPGMEDLEDERGYAKEAGEDFLRRQREEVAKRVAEADLVITTAQIPGRPAPRLISEEMLATMQRGAVVVGGERRQLRALQARRGGRVQGRQDRRRRQRARHRAAARLGAVRPQRAQPGAAVRRQEGRRGGRPPAGSDHELRGRGRRRVHADLRRRDRS